MAERSRKYENLFFALRVLLAVVLLGGLIAGIYLLVYRGQPTVAEWARPGSHEAFVMDGKTYRYVNERGKGGWKSKDYETDKAIGRVADDGTPTETEPPETLPPDAESGETVKVPAPDGTPDLSRDHAYVIYSVKNQEEALLLLEPDGSYSLYWREVATWEDVATLSAFVYEDRTYRLVGALGSNGLSSKTYIKKVKLGLVRNESADTDGEDADHAYLIHTVDRRSHLLVVDAPGGKELLFCREGYANPPETTSTGG